MLISEIGNYLAFSFLNRTKYIHNTFKGKKKEIKKIIIKNMEKDR